MEHDHYKFRCADIGMECGFKAKAHTEGELMQQISKHALEVHDIESVDDDTLQAIKSNIKIERF
jgi:predicted small metal-binding protein